ncbi:hypothetical protein FPZ54_01425 [Sphingomonas suaedae]|uniref:DUF4177 domain-containing protein n=1 Tax=Sphingomonas suaedae TaxID=2599297 RepID=A0A518RBM7_9SPHN|nr:hypothetical protein [Sphingomonas suaedae]QDX24824.1 hypothetical protein FPZ54_01425 [Sphingomonas suaedae]
MTSYKYETVSAFEGNEKFLSVARRRGLRGFTVSEMTSKWAGWGWEIMSITETESEYEDGASWRRYSISMRKPL